MNSPQKYRAILKPEGVSLEETADTHTFTFTTDADTDSSIKNDAMEHASETNVIDPVSLRKYWVVALIRPIMELDPKPVRKFKNTIESFTEDNAENLRSTTQQNTTIIPFSTRKSGATNEWVLSPLVLSDNCKLHFQDWLKNTPHIKNIPVKHIHEAMVHAALMEFPAIAQSFTSNQTTHDDLIIAAISAEKTVIHYLNEIY